MPARQLDTSVCIASLQTANHTFKVLVKWVLRNDDLILFLKAAKIAFESCIGRPSDPIFPLLPEVIGAPDPIIVDVGANMGQFASRVARQFPAGHMYSFEPVRSSAVGLRRVLRWLDIKNVEVFEEAMCDVVGIESMHIPTFSKYQDGALAVLEGSKKPYSNVSYHITQVRTSTIDTFVAAYQITRLDFLKVDTEGAEDRVVRGGMKTIRGLLPTLYLEASPDQPWLNALYDYGYLPFHTDGAKLFAPREQERQNDVLLIHRSKLGLLSKLVETSLDCAAGRGSPKRGQNW